MLVRTWAVWLVAAAVLAQGTAWAGETFAQRVVERARQEVERRVTYEAAHYEDLPYPAGDVPPAVGCCTDLLIRAYRNAGVDLQKAVYEDYKAHADGYPVASRDELSHRRCRNLVVWFRRHAQERPRGLDEAALKDCRPGDVVFFNFAKYDEKYPDHVGIISDRPFRNGVPYVYDNLGPQASERLITTLPIVHSRFRWGEEEAGEPIEPRYAKVKAQGDSTGK